MTRVIGLTGSIATGKSTATKMLRSMGVSVFDADAQVHQMMKPGTPIYDAIAKRFDSCIDDNQQINRSALAKVIYEKDDERKALEAIVHPAIRKKEKYFIRRAIMLRMPIIVLDIPLLFETRAEQLCDEVWVVYCPIFMQYQRAMRRRGMNEEKWKAIMKRQIPQAEKLQKADAAITSALGKGTMFQNLRLFIGESHYA